jgi:hypothetical protein
MNLLSFCRGCVYRDALRVLAPDEAVISQRPPAKPEACWRWSGSKPLGPSERLLRIRSRWVLRAFGEGLSSTIGGRHGTSFTPGDAPLPGASRCSPLPISTGAPISGPGYIPGIVKLWEPPRQSRGVSRSFSRPGLFEQFLRHRLLQSLPDPPRSNHGELPKTLFGNSELAALLQNPTHFPDEMSVEQTV